MTQRYYVPDLPAEGGVVTLSEAEARHASRVMRIQPGDHVTLFDGRGHESPAVVVQVGRNDCVCQASRPDAVSREPARHLELGVALPKGDRARELVERLTELGVARLTPLSAARSQRGYRDHRIEKLRRVVIEASKQCGRNTLMVLAEPTDATEFFTGSDPAADRRIAHPGRDVTQDREATESLQTPPGARPIIAAVGPEGGWTDQEVRTATAHGFRTIGLGRRIYRVETAAVAIAARVATD